MFSCSNFWIWLHTCRFLLTLPPLHSPTLTFLIIWNIHITLNFFEWKMWKLETMLITRVFQCVGVFLAVSLLPTTPTARSRYMIGIPSQVLLVFLCKVNWHDSFHIQTLNINIFIPSCFLGVLWSFIEKAR